jgi:anaerobic ribonucleoside-triphosphate reductase activating protein
VSNLRLSGIVKESTTDGPGIRFTVFTQGCLHNCFGCHNPETHPLVGGKEYNIKGLIDSFKDNPLIDGITLSGGEPFLQWESLLEFILEVKKLPKKYTYIAYTGYLYEELKNSERKALLQELDLLIDGPFVNDLKDLTLWFRGSSNQRVINVKKSLQSNKIVEFDFQKEELTCDV